MIDQAAEMRIPDLFPNGYGEMLLIRNLGDYFAYARSKARRFRIICNTNGYRLTDNKIDAMLKHRVGIVDYVGLAGFSTRAGSSGLAAQPDVGMTEKHPSVLPFQDLNIWSDGKAVLCCEDWNEEHVGGDLNTQTLPLIWRGAMLKDVRRLHTRLQGNQIDLCAKCNAWRKLSRGARLWT